MRDDKLGFTVRIDYLKTLDIVVSGVIVSRPPIEDVKTLYLKLRRDEKLIVADLSNAFEYILNSLNNIGKISVSDDFKKLSTILARNTSIHRIFGSLVFEKRVKGNISYYDEKRIVLNKQYTLYIKCKDAFKTTRFY